MPAVADLHSQIASVMEVLANAAVAEICKAVEDGYAVVNLEMSRSLKENECLRRRVKLLELQVSRYRAEQRLKAPDGSGAGRLFPGVRLLQHRHGRDTPPGPSFQSRPRFLNRPQQKSPATDLDQDPNQEVVTSSKIESREPEENSDLIIVKVEGSASVEDTNNNKDSSTSLDKTSEQQAQSSHTEVSGSQNLTKNSHRNIPLSNCDKTKIYDINATKMPNLSTTSTNETVGTFCSNTTSFSSTTDQQLPNLGSNILLQSNSCNQNITNSSQNNVNGQTPSQDRLRIKPFACSKCPKRFFLELELTNHLNNHSRQKFTCGLCGKGFVCRSQLEIHKNVHTGARPFSCSMCNSWFSHPSNLQRHMKRIHLQSQTHQGGSS